MALTTPAGNGGAKAGGPPQGDVHYRTCPLCEATCGLELLVGGRDIVRVRGDRDDVFSAGFLCPKGAALGRLESDPDRVRRPLVKRDGRFVEVGWDEAFSVVGERLRSILDDHGPDAVATYLGNPTVHRFAAGVYARAFLQALRSKNNFTASTVDQMPKQVSSALLFGGGLSIPVPDVDRTDHLLILGANPYESNGSLMTAPDIPGRLAALRRRGGRLVVVDPQRTKTAENADEHLFIRPGTDAFFLMAMVHVLFRDGVVDLGDVSGHVTGVGAVERLAADFSPEAVEGVCGIRAADIVRQAHDLAAAERAAVYARIGTCTQEFGTLASWAVDLLVTLTGNLDRAGGAMFPKAAAGASNTMGRPGKGRGARLGRRHSRVRGLPEALGELPVVCLAEEIETPGEGQVRALVTLAGNPVVSTPNSGRLDAALGTLEFMVSVDVYVNETTRHADVILPSPPLLTTPHYDIGFSQLSIRNVVNYSPAVVDLDAGERSDAEILSRLALVASGQPVEADPGVVEDLMIASLLQRAVTSPSSPAHGRDVGEIMGLLPDRRGPDRVLDAMLRAGPYGDGFGADPGGLTLEALGEAPHGVDLGPLEPRVPEVLRTASGTIELAPEPLVADVDRLYAALGEGRNGPSLVLVGRRDLRSNNSWMHNVEVLVKGRERCTLRVHPSDAQAHGLHEGGHARVRSRVGEVTVPVEVTDVVMPGVVSIPHGWGHDVDGVEMAVARRHAGVNANVLADEAPVDPLSGNAVLNGIPVTLEAAELR